MLEFVSLEIPAEAISVFAAGFGKKLKKIASSVASAAPGMVGGYMQGGWMGMAAQGLSTLGQLTEPDPERRTGAEMGMDAKAYYDAAFPGTNPWERLGAGNPAGQASIADQQVKNQKKIADDMRQNERRNMDASLETQRRNVDEQMATSQRNIDEQNATSIANVETQTEAQKEVARIKGRADVLKTAARFGPNRIREMGQYVQGMGEAPQMDRRDSADWLTASANWTGAQAAKVRAQVDKAREIWQRAESQGRLGAMFPDVQSAMSAEVKRQAWDASRKDKTWVRWLEKNSDWIRAAGITQESLAAILAIATPGAGAIRLIQSIVKANRPGTSVRAVAPKTRAYGVPNRPSTMSKSEVGGMIN